jgi:hypothetical protein
MKSIQIDLPADASPTLRAIADVFTRQINQRCDVPVKMSGPAEFTLELRIAPGIGAEGFRIEDVSPGRVRIAGNDERGALYGAGKFLRSSRCQPTRFTPGAWRGTSVPEKPVRGIYFATHFFNFYHDAPVEDVQRYVEDLALWGFNVVNVWFDMHHFNGIDDPAAQAMIARLHAILQAANRIGIGASLAFLANEGYANSPAEMRADWTAGHDGYFREPGGHYHVELCPNKPGAAELILRWVDEKLAAFGDLQLDYLWIWPYDQGGCTCAQCAPWGVNGFLKMAEPIARRFRRAFPHGKVILSTWYFDHFINGEWEGLTQAFAQRPDWVDYLMVDDYGDHFPDYPLTHGAPGGFSMVNFPEISMYICDPWGGYGANPMPRHVQQLWDSARRNLSGGFPYSEGIYEDINKAICAQFYWQQDRPALDTVREYAAFEFAPEAVDSVVAAIDILEHNLAHGRRREDGHVRLVMEHSERAGKAYDLLHQAGALLTPQAREAWRWRILYLRALIDAELARTNGEGSDVCEQAFEELTNIYQARRAHDWVAPPIRALR